MRTFEAFKDKGQKLSLEISRLVKVLADYKKKHGHFSKKDSERALTFLRQKEKELNFLKKEINFHTRQIRLSYREKTSNTQAGLLATLAGRGRAIQDKADKKRQVTDELNRVLKPYEELKLHIDKLLNQVASIKISLQESSKNSTDTKPLDSDLANSEIYSSPQASEFISPIDSTKKINYRGNDFSVIEIASLADKLIRQLPPDSKQILELSENLTQEFINSSSKEFVQGIGKFSQDEIMIVTETATKLINKYTSLSREEANNNPQIFKWPTFQPLFGEYLETSDLGVKKRISEQVKSEINRLISARKVRLGSSLSLQEQDQIKSELDELNKYLRAAESLLTDVTHCKPQGFN